MSVEYLERTKEIIKERGWQTGDLVANRDTCEGPVCLLGALALADGGIFALEEALDNYDWFREDSAPSEIDTVLECTKEIIEKNLGETTLGGFSLESAADLWEYNDNYTFNSTTDDNFYNRSPEHVFAALDCAIEKEREKNATS